MLNYFWYQKIAPFSDIRNYFLISEIHTDFLVSEILMIFWYQKIILWSQKMFFWYQKIYIWYQKIIENSDIRKSLSDIISDIRKSFCIIIQWAQFFYIRNSCIIWNQKFDLPTSKIFLEIRNYFLISEILIFWYQKIGTEIQFGIPDTREPLEPCSCKQMVNINLNVSKLVKDLDNY